MLANVGLCGEDIETVFAREREQKLSVGVLLPERFDVSDVYECDRDRLAIGTVRLFAESEGPGDLGGVRD